MKTFTENVYINVSGNKVSQGILQNGAERYLQTSKYNFSFKGLSEEQNRLWKTIFSTGYIWVEPSLILIKMAITP